MGFAEVKTQEADDHLFDSSEPIQTLKKESFIDSIKSIRSKPLNTMVMAWYTVGCGIVIIGYLIPDIFGKLLMSAGILIYYDVYRINHKGSIIPSENLKLQ
jgi:hypothetical protein